MASEAPISPSRPFHDGSEVDDADVEETADEAHTHNGATPKKRRRFPKRLKQFSESTPSTPQAGGIGTPIHRRFPSLPRRSTMPEDRGAVSEGEGHHRRRPLARRGHSHNDRSEDIEEVDTPDAHRRAHFRRISMFGVGGGVSDGEAVASPRRPRFGGERYSTFTGHKWKQVKSTLGLLRHRKGERIDYLKSTELMGELRAGAPAVVMFASMLQRDEHGHKKIPVLLEQVRVTIADSVVRGDSERHTLFTIHLEYGNGPNRMIWKVKRTMGDILRMHFKYKGSVTTARLKRPGNRVGPKQPRFPYKAFPYLRTIKTAKKLEMSDDEDDGQPPETSLPPVIGEDDIGEATGGEATAGETATDAEGRPSHKRRKPSRMNILSPRRRTSMTDDGAGGESQAVEDQKRRYASYQRRALEKYLREMIRWLMFRPDSNRLCRFFELSALGVRLAAEGGYHGKEGFMQLRPANELVNQARKILRKDRKWFLVRQSYIACVDSPESIDICDVYLVDAKFDIICKKKGLAPAGTKKTKGGDDDEGADDVDFLEDHSSKKHHHKLTIVNTERKISLYAQQHDLPQFEDSIKLMKQNSPWASPNIRFDSFAPIRQNVFAQWLVDGRDYMWNVSRAISMAKDVIYIHDWWLSPELYMRRPPCISQRWRLDRLLQQKASEGVKIFVIVYRNVEAAVPIDSEYTKRSLLNLHPNIFVQRSPNQYKKNQFFFAHHEKVCIIDHYIAFCGGIDLCFGRWDTPQHLLSDDKPTGFEPSEVQNVPRDAEHVQMFPGKDYSNPRVQDFFKLSCPYEEMYDRSKTPRMPWHDIAMQVVGQPARDLTRHFVQRWNYVRRNRRITRPLPFLLPPPDFRDEDLEALGLTGTCEVQILRSASTWSLGTQHTECSIQNAYLHMIERSEHFVYMENQFFVSSSEALGVPIVNKIGDALVDRIKRAYANDEDWKCVILIPLMPGFQNTVAESEGTSVRLIMECQYKSICRGEQSIFGKLRAAGIDAEEYIQFFSLRQWGKIGPNQVHATEQLYIHAKTIVVDDRVALIGSANINERSMLGSRDSEIAALVRDTDMLWSSMAGRPFQVGRFAHTLRMRLMREHVGLPVDDIIEEERNAELNQEEAFQSEMERIYGSDDGASPNGDNGTQKGHLAPDRPNIPREHSANYDVDLQLDAAAENERRSSRSSSSSSSSSGSSDDPVASREALPNPEQQREVQGYGADHWKDAQKSGLDQGRDSVVIKGREFLARDIFSEGKGTIESPAPSPHSPTPQSAETDATAHVPSNDSLPPFVRRTTEQLDLPRANQLPDLPVTDDTDIGGPSLVDPDSLVHPLMAEIRLAAVDKDCMKDPLDPDFYENVWLRIADNNTKLYRQVFHCMPDNDVQDWGKYMDFMDHQARLKADQDAQESQENGERPGETEKPRRESTGGGAGLAAPGPGLAARVLSDRFIKRTSSGKPLPPLPGSSKKVPDKDESPAHRHTRQNSRLEIERQAVLERIAGSPMASPAMHPPGNSPFLSRPKSPATADRSHLFAPRANGKGDKAAAAAGSKANRRATFRTPEEHPNEKEKEKPTTADSGAGSYNSNNAGAANAPVKRRRRATTRGSRNRPFMTEELLTNEQRDALCNMIQGHLVVFPYDWLVGADERGDWLTLVDQAAPLQI